MSPGYINGQDQPVDAITCLFSGKCQALYEHLRLVLLIQGIVLHGYVASDETGSEGEISAYLYLVLKVRAGFELM